MSWLEIWAMLQVIGIMIPIVIFTIFLLIIIVETIKNKIRAKK